MAKTSTANGKDDDSFSASTTSANNSNYNELSPQSVQRIVDEKIQGFQKDRPQHFYDELSNLLSEIDQELEQLASQQRQQQTSSTATAGAAITALGRSVVSRKDVLKAFKNTLEKWEQLEDQNKEKLPQDTFSFFLIASSGTSSPVLYALSASAIQVTALVLTIVDKLGSKPNSYNPLNLPANVDLPVRLAQLIALLVTMVSQDDTIIALGQLSDGYDGNILSTVFPNISRTKWFISVLLRLLVGLLVLFVVFLLIVQEESVIEIFLNFLAINFVGELDDIAFQLATGGFAGKVIGDFAKLIERSWFPSRGSWDALPNSSSVNVRPSMDNPTAATRNMSKRGCCSNGHRLKRRYSIALLLALMLAAWGLVVNRQNSGYLLTREIYVQFGDDFSPALGTLSGFYSRQKVSFGGRATYVEERSGRALLGYCSEISAWTFTYSEIGELDPCNYMVKSTETVSYDLMRTLVSPWYDVDEDRGDLPMKFFFMSSFDCRDGGICGNHGTCSSGSTGCTCDEGWFGLRCDFPVPCPSIESDEKRGGFLGTRQWSTQFDILKDSNGQTVEVSNRPVYGKQSEIDQVFDMIFFTGRRWVVTHSGLLEDFRQELPVEDPSLNNTMPSTFLLSEYLKSEFHPYWSNFSVAFVSEPVDVGTPKDAAMPISLQWYNTKVSGIEKTSVTADETDALAVTLICAVCHNVTNPCFFDSHCQRDGVCECTTRASGTLCQIPPVSNGRCDSFFNNPEYLYDGGDCCQATCFNSDEYICGIDLVSSGLRAYVGFDKCSDPTQVCESCWKPLFSSPLQSQPTTTDFHKLFNNNRYMAISGDGKTIAVHDGSLSRGFQVYSIETSQWMKQGEILTDTTDKAFVGDSVALSRDGWVVAVGGSDAVQVYERGSFGWLERGQKLSRNEPDQVFDIAMQVDISESGDVLAVAFSSPGAVMVYEGRKGGDVDLNTNFAGYEWVARGDGPVLSKSSEFDMWYAISLSGDGNTVAIGTRAEIGPQSLIPDEDVVQVFQWNGTSWDQLGPALTVPGVFFGCFGCAVALSRDSKILAIGSPDEESELLRGGTVRTYEWDGTMWLQKGNTIPGRLANIHFGYSVALSDDGRILAVGSDPQSKTSGVFQTYIWNDNAQDWEILGGETFTVGIGSIGAFTNDASLLAVSSFVEDGREDIIETNIYRFQSSLTQCKESESLLRLSLLTDARGQDIEWRVEDEEGNTLFEKENLYIDGRSTPYVREWCIDTARCLTLKIFDFGGNGLCCSNGEGAYILWLDGVEIANGGDFSWYEEVRIGSCAPKCSNGTSLLRLELMLDRYGSELVWNVRDQNDTIVFEEGGKYPDDNNGIVVRETCLSPQECHTFTMSEDCDGIFATVNNPECGLGFEDQESGYRITFDGQEIGYSTDFILVREHAIGRCDPLCKDGQSLLRFLLRTDEAGQETTWAITTETGEVLLEGGPYTSWVTSSVVESICIDLMRCTIVTVYDSGGDGMFGPISGVGGFFLELDGQNIKFGGTFGSSDSTRLGNCAPTQSPTTMPTTLVSGTLSIPPTSESTGTVNNTTNTSSGVTSTPSLAEANNTATKSCESGTSLLQISIYLDFFPGETTWTLEASDTSANKTSNSTSGDILREGGPYETSGLVQDGLCVSPNRCFTLTVLDSASDGIFSFGGVTMTLGEESASISGFSFQDIGIVSIGQCAL